MTTSTDFEILLVTFPGLEQTLCAEAKEQGFPNPQAITGGVITRGGWPEIWRANLCLRGTSRVLVRLDSFPAGHLSQLDKRARRVPWGQTLRPDVPVRVEAACKASRIYHAGAAKERIARAIAEELGAPISDEAELCIKVRIHKDVCTISLDTSGDGLHKRGHKEEVNKAPMRETMAALFLRQCGFTGTEPVLDPMCGSGTFPIEAAEIASGRFPGRSRRFAFEQLVPFDAKAWERLCASEAPTVPDSRFYGSDRDPGAIRMSLSNAERAEVQALTVFQQTPIQDLKRPDSPPGLVIINPPYGGRIGDRKKLGPLYRSLGQTLRTRFQGWRVGLITNDASLAQATQLPFSKPSEPVLHGGIRIALYSTAPLGSSHR